MNATVIWSAIVAAVGILAVFAPAILRWMARRDVAKLAKMIEDERNAMRKAVGDNDTGAISDGMDRLRDRTRILPKQ